MDNGTIDGEHIEWNENGNVKLKEYCKLTKSKENEYGKYIF